MERQTKKERWGMRAGKALALAASLGAMSACDDLLEVEIPHLLTGDAISGPNSAQTQLSSAIGLFECGTSSFGWVALGHEDVMESIAGVAGTVHVWRPSPVTGTCDTGSATQNWFDQFMGARAFLVGIDPSTSEPSGIYTRLVNDWDATLVPDREEIMAIGAIYMAAALTHFGEFYCEGALDIGPLMTPTDFLDLADDWIDSANIHLALNPGGDVELPNGIAASGVNLATALRARIRVANGDLAGGAAAAQAVLASDPRFESFITREAGLQRRNKIYHAANSAGFSAGLGVINWWGTSRAANPVPIVGTTPAAGTPANRWPNPIPFTGYIALGVGPNGETLTNLATQNIPVRWAGETRTATGALDPAGTNLAGSVADSRVPTIFKSIQGPNPAEVPAKYASDSDPIPWVTWRELTLILAEWENTTNNDQGAAIGHINDLRTFHGLPQISGTLLLALTDGLGDDQLEVRLTILEEYRRELFAEAGRYWSVKIRNTDALWFPRRQGSTPTQSYNILGGVRLHFPNDEYTVNPNFTGLPQRGTGCSAAERPTP